LLRSASTIRVKGSLPKVLRVNLVDSVTCVKSHYGAGSTYHLKLARLNARANAAAVLVKDGHCLMMHAGKECVVIVLELVNDS